MYNYIYDYMAFHILCRNAIGGGGGLVMKYRVASHSYDIFKSLYEPKRPH